MFLLHSIKLDQDAAPHVFKKSVFLFEFVIVLLCDREVQHLRPIEMYFGFVFVLTLYLCLLLVGQNVTDAVICK